MKAAFIIAAAGVAVAQNLSGVPTCATSCLSSAITAAGCAPTDVGCQCGPTKSAIAGLAAPCLISACTAATDLVGAQSAGDALCSIFSAGETASPSATTTTGAGSGSVASTTTVVETTTSTGAVETTSGSVTTSVPVTTTATSSMTVINGTVTTGSPSGTTGGTSGSTAGAAPTGVAMGAGALLAFLGAVAAL